jgi:hypothetical protein
MKFLDVWKACFQPHLGRKCIAIRRLDAHGGPKEMTFFEHKVLIEAVQTHDFSGTPLLEKYWGPLVVVVNERLRDVSLHGDYDEFHDSHA